MSPSGIVPLGDLSKLVDDEKGRSLSEMSPGRQKLYRRVKRDIENRTDHRFTDEEYHHLAILFLVLDDADAYIQRAGGPQSVDPELLNQIRLMRDSFLQRMKEAREGHETVGSILKDTKEAMIRLKSKVGEELTIIKTEEPDSLLELMEQEISAKTKTAADAEKKREVPAIVVEKTE